MKVSVFFEIVLIVSCSASFTNSGNSGGHNSCCSGGGYGYNIGHGGHLLGGDNSYSLGGSNNYKDGHGVSSLGGDNSYYSGGGYNYNVGYSEPSLNGGRSSLSEGRHSNDEGVVQTVHNEGDSFAGVHGGHTVGNGIQEEFKSIKVIHEQVPRGHSGFPSLSPRSQQELRNIKVIHEYQSSGGQQEYKTLKVIHEQQPFANSASRDYGSLSPIAEVKTIKVIHEQQPQQKVSFLENHHHNHAPVEEVKTIYEGQPHQHTSIFASQRGRYVDTDIVKIIKVIHEHRTGGGVHGYFSGDYSAPAAGNYADIGFFDGDYFSGRNVDAGSSSGAGYDDTFETLKSLKIINTLSPNGGISAERVNNGGSFPGSYSSTAPTNYYLPPSGGF